MKKQKIASFSQLINCIRTRKTYANNAIERDSLSGDPIQEKRADEAFEKIRVGNLDYNEWMYYAEREKEWKELHD